MKASQKRAADVLATGWLTLVVWCVVFFLARWYAWSALAQKVYLHGAACPSGLLPRQIEDDPNVTVQSGVSASYAVGRGRTPWGGLLAIGSGVSPDAGVPMAVDVLDTRGGSSLLTYWERTSGQFILQFMVRSPDKGKWALRERLYAGPDGMSERMGAALGRFVDPILGTSWGSWRRSKGLVYDAGSRRFYRIDWTNRSVLKGPVIAQGVQPMQIGSPTQVWYHVMTGLSWSAPVRKVREGETGYGGQGVIPIDPNVEERSTRDEVMVLSKDGQIYRVDPGSLALSALPVGYLPAVGPRFSSRPRDLLAYDVLPVRIQGQYAGCAAAAVGADGTAIEIGVYDPDGRLVGPLGHPNRGAKFEEDPAAPGVLACQYLLECLHPLSLGLLSRAVGPHVAAVAGQGGLFVLPDSFVATRAREPDSYPVDRLFWTCAMLLPAALLAAFLAWKVARDAAVAGLSRTATHWWIAGTVAFGVPAYITYRLVRSDVTLVTCGNCGQRRRPDMERCHRCGAPWAVPEITPPAWRVAD